MVKVIEDSILAFDTGTKDINIADDFKINPVSILYKSIAGRYRPVRVADGPITARYRFIKNASWECA